MTQKKAQREKTQEVLGWIAFGSRNDIRVGLNVLRARYFPTYRKVRLIGTQTDWLRRYTKSLIDEAVQIAEGRGREDSKKKRIKRIVFDTFSGGGFPIHFQIALDSRSERPKLRFIAVNEQDQSDLPLDMAVLYVTYAFQDAACDATVRSWLTFQLRKCVACQREFRDLRPVMRGGDSGPRHRCEDCIDKDKRKRGAK